MAEDVLKCYSPDESSRTGHDQFRSCMANEYFSRVGIIPVGYNIEHYFTNHIEGKGRDTEFKKAD